MFAKGLHGARKLTQILLLSDESRTGERIVAALGVGVSTVEHLRKRCALDGWAVTSRSGVEVR
jgi:hypothetical protein